VQQSPIGQQSSLTAERAASLIDEWLAAREYRPSEGLRAVFARAGTIVSDTGSTRNVISSRFLLFALVESVSEKFLLPSEVQMLVALGGLFDGRRYQAQFDEYFGKAKASGTAEPPGLSPNVERLLEAALASAGQSRSDRVVTIVDVLLCYPPEGSKGQALLSRLGVTASTLHAMILAELAKSEEGNVPPPPPAPLTSTTTPTQGSSGPARKGGSTPAATKAAARKRPQINERVFTHSDVPAVDDHLGRKPFAEVLAGRIREAREGGGEDEKRSEEGLSTERSVEKGETDEREKPAAFVVHLHGPWGSGKSSVLNFLEQELSQEAEPWLVVRFDAWRNQRLQPPWWSLITSIYATARHSLNWRKALRLRLRWLIWRIRADYVPLIAVAACAAALMFLLLWVGAPGAAATTPGGNQEQFANWIDKLLKLIAGAITIIGAIVLWSRSLAMGSQRAAQAYADLKTDPYGPIAKLFNRLIDAINQPVVVFVDDLDRCESKYVVDLLEGIQTLMRGAAVTYVVAGDRKWICSSFEQRYGAFSPPIGEPGRPLGYLFLDKIFQISAAIPQPDADAQRVYWKELLDPASHTPQKQREKLVKAAVKAKADASKLTRQEDLQELVSTAERSGDAATIQATRAAAAKRIASQPAAAEMKHRLERYVALLEPNPRAMKRLVNAYGMHQAALFLAGRSCPPDALARWTILELRWPLLADFLANRPLCVDRLHARLAKTALPQVPEPLRALFGDELVRGVIGQKKSRNRLSATAIRAILGAAQGER